MKQKAFTLILGLLIIMLVVFILAGIPPFSGIGQPKFGLPPTKKLLTQTTTTDVNKTVIVAKQEVSNSIKRIMDDQKQKDVLILKLQNELSQLKDDRDNEITEKNKLKQQNKVYQQSILKYLANKDKNLDYDYSTTYKDSVDGVYNTLNFKIRPNKKDTVYLQLPPILDTVTKYHVGPFGWLGIGKAKYKPINKTTNEKAIHVNDSVYYAAPYKLRIDQENY